MSQTAMRREVVIIVAPIRGVLSFHFTSTALQGADLWFPMGEDGLSFPAVEAVMVANGVAHNVSGFRELGASGESTDYAVIFNKGEKYQD